MIQKVHCLLHSFSVNVRELTTTLHWTQKYLFGLTVVFIILTVFLSTGSNHFRAKNNYVSKV